MWGFSLVPVVPVLVSRRRRRRLCLDRFPPVHIRWTRYDVEARDTDVLYNALIELLELRDRGLDEYGWEQSADMIAQVLREQGWEVDRETLELVEIPRGGRAQFMIQDRPHEEQHFHQTPDEIHIHGQQQQEIHLQAPASEVRLHPGQTQDIHVHEQEPELHYSQPVQQNIIHHPATHKKVFIGGRYSHSIPINQEQTLTGQAGPAYSTPKAIEPKKEQRKDRKGKSKSKSQRRVSSEDEYESEESDCVQKSTKGKGKGKGKSRHRRPLEDEEYESEDSDRGRSKNASRRKTQSKPREPSVSEYDSESSGHHPQRKKPITARPSQIAITDTPHNKVEGFEDDYESGSNFEFARSDESDVGVRVSKTRDGYKRKTKQWVRRR